MNILPDDQWQKVLPAIRQAFPRLTELDVVETRQRIDLLCAKIQNRHWISKDEARASVLRLLKGAGLLTAV